MARRAATVVLLLVGTVLSACGADDELSNRDRVSRIIEDCIAGSVVTDSAGNTIAGPAREVYRPCITEQVRAAVADGDLPRGYVERVED